MNALKDCIRIEGVRLAQAARRMGGSIAFDADSALFRDLPGLSAPGLISPNGQCHLLRAADGWVAVNLAREDDRAAVPAWLGCPIDGNNWSQIAQAAAGRGVANLIDQAVLLHMPVAAVGKSQPGLPVLHERNRRESAGRPRVIDLSALWAGPLCAGFLAEAGAEVVKVDSLSRPDPTPVTTPLLHARLNGRKRVMRAEFGAPAVHALIAKADVLVTSGRPHALARMGFDEARLFAANPRLLWVAITAHGWIGEGAMRVGFGDDCAAAGGLVRWHDGIPAFIGDALADPLTGMSAARVALEALAEGKSGLIDAALAPTAAHYASIMGLRP